RSAQGRHHAFEPSRIVIGAGSKLACVLPESLPTCRTLGLRPADRSPTSVELLQIDPPDILFPQVGEPDRTVAGTNGIAARAGELPDNRIGFRIDLRDRHLENGRPDTSFAKSEFSPAAGNAGFDCDGEFPGLGIYTGNGAVTLIQAPNRP